MASDRGRWAVAYPAGSLGEEAHPEKTRPGRQPFSLILTSAGLSAVGDGIRTAALPLLVLSISHNPIAVSSVAVFNRLPWLITSLYGGVIADRYDRRTLMVIVDATRAVAMAGLALFILSGLRYL